MQRRASMLGTQPKVQRRREPSPDSDIDDDRNSPQVNRSALQCFSTKFYLSVFILLFFPYFNKPKKNYSTWNRWLMIISLSGFGDHFNPLFNFFYSWALKFWELNEFIANDFAYLLIFTLLLEDQLKPWFFLQIN